MKYRMAEGLFEVSLPRPSKKEIRKLLIAHLKAMCVYLCITWISTNSLWAHHNLVCDVLFVTAKFLYKLLKCVTQYNHIPVFKPIPLDASIAQVNGLKAALKVNGQ